MNKNKLLLLISISSVLAITGTVFISHSEYLNNNSAVFAINRNGGSRGSGTWYHYAAIAPTSTRHGSVEFWANSNSNCSEHIFDGTGIEGAIERDYSTYEAFYELTSSDPEYVAPTSSNPIDNGDGTVTYGLYPQTHVNNATTLEYLDNIVGSEEGTWYCYQGEYYAKISSATPNGVIKFKDNTTIVSGNTYWFKCEPILWNKLPSSDIDGTYYLLTDESLDVQLFYNSTSNRIEPETIYANNYKHSDIRDWLNDDFYNSAFRLGNAAIQTTNIDNSASTTNNASNLYYSDDTEDKVYLPSYQDYVNASYGFSDNASRIAVASDWARARKAYGTNAEYWTRSPYSVGPSKVSTVSYSGSLTNEYANYGMGCVRPAITITIA